MAKIKFYLDIEGKKIRTLDELRENFFADSVFAHYNSGELVRWLDIYGYKYELEQVLAIKAIDAQEIIAELYRIFGIGTNLEYLTSNESRVEATNIEVNLGFFEDWIHDDKDGSKRKSLNDWIALFPPLMIAITHGDISTVKTLIQ